MKIKNKGRKIYKTKEKNYYGKSPFGKFMSGALSVLLIGGLGFLGYSVAEPIINYTRKAGDEEPSASVTETKEQTESFSADVTVNSVDVMDNISVEQYRAASVRTEDMTSTEALAAALERVPSGTEYISVPLKAKGGGIYYASSVSEAGLCGAVKSALTLNDITTTVKAAGFKPVAELSLLYDNIFPAAYPDAGYKIADGGSMWIDDALENGGKPWMTPMSDVTRSYLSALGDEIASAGFEKVICEDVVFPPFRESDLALLGEEVSKGDRYLSLTSLVNSLYSKFISGGTAMMLEVSAAEILSGGGEVIQPMVLDVNTLVLKVDFDEIGQSVTAPDTVYEFSGTAEENAKKIIGLVKDRLSDYNVVVRFSGKNTEQSELIKAKEAISDYGYSSYIIG